MDAPDSHDRSECIALMGWGYLKEMPTHRASILMASTQFIMGEKITIPPALEEEIRILRRDVVYN
jgi:hypothetical protein